MKQYQVNVAPDTWRDCQKDEYDRTPNRSRRVMYLENKNDDSALVLNSNQLEVLYCFLFYCANVSLDFETVGPAPLTELTDCESMLVKSVYTAMMQAKV